MCFYIQLFPISPSSTISSWAGFDGWARGIAFKKSSKFLKAQRLPPRKLCIKKRHCTRHLEDVSSHSGEVVTRLIDSTFSKIWNQYEFHLRNFAFLVVFCNIAKTFAALLYSTRINFEISFKLSKTKLKRFKMFQTVLKPRNDFLFD